MHAIFKALQDCLVNKQHTYFVLVSFLFCLPYIVKEKKNTGKKYVAPIAGVGDAMHREPPYFDNPGGVPLVVRLCPLESGSSLMTNMAAGHHL